MSVDVVSRAIMKRRLVQVIQSHGSNCYWCGAVIVRIADVPMENRISQTPTTISFWRDNKVVTALYATLDHVVPFSKGGKTDTKNCVPSCAPCNNSRGNEDAVLGQRG